MNSSKVRDGSDVSCEVTADFRDQNQKVEKRQADGQDLDIAAVNATKCINLRVSDQKNSR